MSTQTPHNLDFVTDVPDCAHALLQHNWPRAYTALLSAWHSKSEDRLYRLYDGWRQEPDAPRNMKLFWALLAFAQPDIFKFVYHTPKQCLGLLTYGLKYMYYSPRVIAHALDLLDDKELEEDKKLEEESEAQLSIIPEGHTYNVTDLKAERDRLYEELMKFELRYEKLKDENHALKMQLKEAEEKSKK